eukprot:GILI01003641.1.p1 GENE.GILI01003641.1~~GILI01003641.1.p1  ORF type:complete len:290 (+),score=69.63 GILI01003641.1:53-871(+)
MMFALRRVAGAGRVAMSSSLLASSLPATSVLASTVSSSPAIFSTPSRGIFMMERFTPEVVKELSEESYRRALTRAERADVSKRLTTDHVPLDPRLFNIWRREWLIPASVEGSDAKFMVNIRNMWRDIYKPTIYCRPYEIVMLDGSVKNVVVQDFYLDRSIDEKPLSITFKIHDPPTPTSIRVPFKLVGDASAPFARKGGRIKAVGHREHLAISCTTKEMPTLLLIDVSQVQYKAKIRLCDLDHLLPAGCTWDLAVHKNKKEVVFMAGKSRLP